MSEGLRTDSIFRFLSREQMEQVSEIAVEQRQPPDKVTFFQGDHSREMYFILSGSVRVYQTSPEGQEKIITTLGMGNFFGEMALLHGQPRQASVATNEKTVLLVIGPAEFHALCLKNPEILWQVNRALCERICRENEDRNDQSFQDVPYRLHKRLVRLAKDHGEQRLDGLRIGIRLTPRILAGMIGTTAMRVAELLAEYQEQRVLRREGDYLTILDPKSFERSLEYQRRID